MNYLQVENSGNTWVIDDDFQNFEVVQRGMASPGGYTYYPGDTATYANLIFVRPLTDGVGFTQSGGAPGGHNGMGMLPAGTYFALRGESAISYEYFVARLNNTAPPEHGQGIEVFDGNGRVVFDSDREYLKIIDFFFATHTGPNSITTRNLPALSAGKNYFFCINWLPVSHVSTSEEWAGGSTDTMSASWGFKKIGSQLQVNPMLNLEGWWGDTLVYEIPVGTSIPVLVAEA